MLTGVYDEEAVQVQRTVALAVTEARITSCRIRKYSKKDTNNSENEVLLEGRGVVSKIIFHLSSS